VTRGFLDEVAQLSPDQPLTWDAIFSAEGMQRMKPAGLNPPDPRVPAVEKTNYYIYELPLTYDQLRALPVSSSTREALSSQPRELITSSWADAAPAETQPAAAPAPSAAQPIAPATTPAAPVQTATPLAESNGGMESPDNVHALLIGINTYLAPSLNALRGCEQDIQAFDAFLRQRLRLRDDCMTVLLSTNTDPRKQPTRDNIITAMIDLGARIKSGDRVILYYAGHGSRIENQGQRSIETIVPMDSRLENIYDIRDFELSVLLQGITSKTDDVTVILDSCHSSGATRGEEKRPTIERRAEPDKRPQPEMDSRINQLQATLNAIPAPARPLVPGADSASVKVAQNRSISSTGEDGWGLNPENRYIVIAGCQAQESSAEQPLGANGEYRGLLSWHLLATLQSRRQGPDALWDEIFPTVQRAVTTDRAGQRPVINGDRKRFVFGGAWTPRDPGFGVMQQGDQFSLDTGAVAGVTPGVLVGVYRSGLPEFPNDQATDQQQRLCTLEVTRASALKAIAQLVTGTLPAQDVGPLRGRVVVPRPTDRLPVRLPASELSSIVMRSPWLAAGDSPVVEVRVTNNAYQLVRTADQRIVASIEQSPEAATKVCLSLERYARYWSTMTRQNESERIPSNQALEVRLFNPNKDQELRKNEDGSYIVPLKSDFVIVIRNTSAWPLYAICVNFTDSIQVEYIYPYSEEAPIAPGEARAVGEGWLSDTPLRSVQQLPAVRPFVAGLPEGISQGTDRLRVFGTTGKPIDVRDLLELVPRLEKFAQALPGQVSSDYAPVTAGIDSGSRNLAPMYEEQEDMWTVTDCVVHIA